MHDRTLLGQITKYSGDEQGTGALMTWVDSGWLMSIVVPYQPRFPDMPEHTYTLWGYGLLIDNGGDYVTKKISQATGEDPHRAHRPARKLAVLADADLLTALDDADMTAAALLTSPLPHPYLRVLRLGSAGALVNQRTS
jgi:hypothetical protein